MIYRVDFTLVHLSALCLFSALRFSIYWALQLNFWLLFGLEMVLDFLAVFFMLELLRFKLNECLVVRKRFLLVNEDSLSALVVSSLFKIETSNPLSNEA